MHQPRSTGGADRLGDVGLAAGGVADVEPGVFFDTGDRCFDLGDEAQGDRLGDGVGVEGVAEFPGPEPRIGPSRRGTEHGPEGAYRVARRS